MKPMYILTYSLYLGKVGRDPTLPRLVTKMYVRVGDIRVHSITSYSDRVNPALWTFLKSASCSARYKYPYCKLLTLRLSETIYLSQYNLPHTIKQEVGRYMRTNLAQPVIRRRLNLVM